MVSSFFAKKDSLFLIFDDLGTKTLQTLCWDLCNSDKRVELFLCVLIVIPLASNTNSDTSWNTSDAPAPDLLVQLHIHSDILCSHSFLCKLPDLLDGCRGLLFECAINNIASLMLANINKDMKQIVLPTSQKGASNTK